MAWPRSLRSACLLVMATASPAAAQMCPAAVQLSHQGDQIHIDIDIAARNPDVPSPPKPDFAIFQDGNPPTAVRTRIQVAPSEIDKLFVTVPYGAHQPSPGILLGTVDEVVGPVVFKGLEQGAVGNDTPTPPAGTRLLSLARIMFSEGAPDQQSWLVPDSDEDGVSAWHFAASRDADVWMSCGYGATNLLLSLRLPPAIKSCRLSAGTDPHGAPTLACGAH